MEAIAAVIFTAYGHSLNNRPKSAITFLARPSETVENYNGNGDINNAENFVCVPPTGCLR
jgi:hypothetical protein